MKSPDAAGLPFTRPFGDAGYESALTARDRRIDVLEYELRLAREDLRDARSERAKGAGGGGGADASGGDLGGDAGEEGEVVIREEDYKALDGMVQGYLKGRGYKMAAVQMGVERVDSGPGVERLNPFDSSGAGGVRLEGRRLEDVYCFKVRDIEDKERQIEEIEGIKRTSRRTIEELEGKMCTLSSELRSTMEDKK
ncbi:hypothetical protein TrRE_jg4217, partial [Triparma retinervis]